MAQVAAERDLLQFTFESYEAISILQVRLEFYETICNDLEHVIDIFFSWYQTL